MSINVPLDEKVELGADVLKEMSIMLKTLTNIWSNFPQTLRVPWLCFSPAHSRKCAFLPPLSPPTSFAIPLFHVQQFTASYSKLNGMAAMSDIALEQLHSWAAPLLLWSLVFFSFCKTVKCFNDAHIIDCITGVVIMRYSEGELFPHFV